MQVEHQLPQLIVGNPLLQDMCGDLVEAKFFCRPISPFAIDELIFVLALLTIDFCNDYWDQNAADAANRGDKTIETRVLANRPPWIVAARLNALDGNVLDLPYKLTRVHNISDQYFLNIMIHSVFVAAQ